MLLTVITLVKKWLPRFDCEKGKKKNTLHVREKKANIKRKKERTDNAYRLLQKEGRKEGRKVRKD